MCALEVEGAKRLFRDSFVCQIFSHSLEEIYPLGRIPMTITQPRNLVPFATTASTT